MGMLHNRASFLRKTFLNAKGGKVNRMFPGREGTSYQMKLDCSYQLNSIACFGKALIYEQSQVLLQEGRRKEKGKHFHLPDTWKTFEKFQL